MPTLASPEYSSVIRSEADCSNQDIHLDAMEPGWSFLTALERDQEVLILWNGYTCICIMEPLIKDKTAACASVRDAVLVGDSTLVGGTTFTEKEWTEKIEPRVWNWLCTMQMQLVRGSTPALQIKRVRIEKGWTIAIDSRTPHGGAAWLPKGTEEALRVHMYAVDRPIVRADPTEEAETQDSTIDPRYSAYVPMLHWAQRQVVPAFEHFK
jgi:hypothetical protein